MEAFKQAMNEVWVPYVSEKFGFTFNYPQSWTVLTSSDGAQIIVRRPGNQVELPLVIRVVRFEDAPQTYRSNPEYVFDRIYTQDELSKMMRDAQEQRRLPDKNGKYVLVGNEYSLGEYHNFYREANFFLYNNLITVTQPLSVVVPDIAGHKTELLAKVRSNQVGDLAIREADFTDRLVESFRTIPLVGETRDFGGDGIKD